MKKRIFSLLIVLSVLVLIVRFSSVIANSVLGFSSKSGIKVTSTPSADVFLNGNKVGQTPYQDENLKQGEYDVKLTAGDSSWQGKVALNDGTLSVVNREISPTVASSSGEILTLTTGSGVVVTSNPNGSDVEIDGKNYGKTPISIPNVAPGEHSFILSHSDFLKRSIRAVLPAKMNLSLSVDLAISEADLSTITTPEVVTENKVTVKQTPTGFLNVRDKPSLDGLIVSKVSPGQELIMLEETNGWMKVRLSDDTEGYVSSSYVSK